MPAREIPDVNVPLADKWVHFIFFGGFSLLWLCARPQKKLSHLLAMFCTGIGFGILIECLQYLFRALGRSADILDVMADAIGCMLGILVFYLLARIAAQKEQHINS